MSGNKPSIHARTPDLAQMLSGKKDLKHGDDQAPPMVLAIDDEPKLLSSTQALLVASGYQCLTAEDGKAGLDILNSTAIDIVLLDLSMPGIDGYQVLETIHDSDIDVDVIIVSGEATFDNAKRVFQEGAIDFLNKPYKTQQLISTVENVIYRRRLRQNLEYVQRRLEESEQRYRFIVSYSPDIIYMVDHQGHFVFINERVYDLLGYHPEELIGQHFSKLVTDDDIDLAQHIFNERRTGERASHNVELKLKCSGKLQQHKSFESNNIVIELCSMGIYDNEQDKTPYLGTYGVARDISERKKAQELIHFQAYHDLLTKLPNRELFLDRLHQAISQALRNDTRLAVFFLDIDGFKFINDSLGHVVGDKLLKQAARRLRKTLRDSDTVSRIGGDEFNILVPEINSPQQAGLIAQKIISAFSKPIVLDEHEITISFSIGISVFPDDAQNTDQLIINSDMAMYHIKGRGKNGYEFFSNHMQSLYNQRHSIEQDIRKALESRQFEAWYQPQYNIMTQKIIGLEALIRWNHPEKGLITPDHFIPIAEEIGLINEIGLYMLETGCIQLKKWLDSGHDPFKLSINVSCIQLTEYDFDITLCELVGQFDLPRNSIMLEITESSLMQDMDAVIPHLKNLVDCGIGISIDDFGVGYSSLSYLQSLPINMLKIDRSFLNGNESPSSIIKAIVAMARELDLDVIMEGVETDQQLAHIRDIGCDMVQGFLLGKPLPVMETGLLLQAASGKRLN